MIAGAADRALVKTAVDRTGRTGPPPGKKKKAYPSNKLSVVLWMLQAAAEAA